MVMNYNSSFMGGMNYGAGNGYAQNRINNSQIPAENVHLQFKAKYGTEDCFKQTPYIQEYPKPYIPLSQNAKRTPTIIKLLKNFIG